MCGCPLADGALDVAYPDVLVLLGGSVELVHLRRQGVADEEHASLLICDIPHYQVLKGQHWRFVLDRTGESNMFFQSSVQQMIHLRIKFLFVFVCV